MRRDHEAVVQVALEAAMQRRQSNVQVSAAYNNNNSNSAVEIANSPIRASLVVGREEREQQVVVEVNEIEVQPAADVQGAGGRAP